MKLLDTEIVHKHLRDMGATLTYLRGKGGISENELLENFEQRLAIERAFHLAIQNMIDVGSHILAYLDVGDIQTYADIPEKLSEAGVISANLSDNLTNMAKFRNILVHDYIKIESKKLISCLRNNLSDFEDFSKAIVRYLESVETPQGGV